MKYWRLNPGQESVDPRDSPENPVTHIKSTVRRSISSASRGRSRSMDAGGGSGQFSEKPVAPHESGPVGSTGGGSTGGEGSRGRLLRPNDSVV